MDFFDKLLFKTEKIREKRASHPKQAALSIAWWSAKQVFSPKEHSAFKDNHVHILVDIRGGLGDMMFSVGYINAISKYFNQKITVLVGNDLAIYKDILLRQPSVDDVITSIKYHYDIEIKIIHYPFLEYVDSSRISTFANEKIKSYVNLLTDFYNENIPIFMNDYLGRCFAKINGKKRGGQADIYDAIGIDDTTINFGTLPHNPYNFPYITLQTGGGMHFLDIKNETRQWPLEHYNCLVDLIKKDFPQVKIIQLGDSKQSKINGVDIDLRGQTTIFELFAILKDSKLHIQQEGGLAIVRHFLCGKPSVVLFGPTDDEFYGFEENLNLRADDYDCICEWLSKNWIKRCCRTGEAAPCMQALSPKFVFGKIRENKLLEHQL